MRGAAGANGELLSELDALTAPEQQELVSSTPSWRRRSRGVMAMYTQLSEELEDTNRGVVARYAELVDTTTLAGSAVDELLAGLRPERADP